MTTTSPRKLRWGILGVASINQRLLPAFAAAQNLELRAIASRSLAKAQAAAQQANIPVAHGSYEALLDDPTIDAVYNPLPNTLHAEWTRKAAERGKHILCEKPLCPSAAEAAELVAFCRGKGVQLMEGFMWPHHPRTEELRQLLDTGILGPVKRVTGAFTFRMDPLDPNNIRLKPDLAGGSLLDVGCYPVYGIRWAFGAEPVRVWATAHYQHGVDVALNGILWFPDGGIGAFDCGFTEPLRMWLEIVGPKGVLRVPRMWLPGPNAEWELHYHGETLPRTIATTATEQMVHMLENFSRAALDKAPVLPAPEEAVKTLRVLDALAQSARTGQAVEV